MHLDEILLLQLHVTGATRWQSEFQYAVGCWGAVSEDRDWVSALPDVTILNCLNIILREAGVS